MAVLVVPVAAGCGKDSAVVRGHLIGCGDQTVWLERVDANDPAYDRQVLTLRATVVDSTVTSAAGKFRFRVSLPGGRTTIFNLRVAGNGGGGGNRTGGRGEVVTGNTGGAGVVGWGNRTDAVRGGGRVADAVRGGGDDKIPLLISAGERIRVMSFGNPERGYSVSGSPGSESVARVHKILSDGAASLDSISRLFVMSPRSMRQDLSRAYSAEYYRIKRAQIEFIVENSSSLAAVYALGEHLPGDDALFGGRGQFYYRMVADSAGRYYPDSQYVVALKKLIVQ